MGTAPAITCSAESSQSARVAHRCAWRTADEAVRQAHLWATRADCELSALHVMAGAVPMHPLFPQLHEQDATAAVALERQLAERLSERINRCIGRDLDSSSVYVDFG